MDKPDDIVLLCRDEVYMLHIIKGVLEDNGIESMIADETIVGVYGAPGCSMGLARLLVFRRDYDKARAIVDRIQTEKTNNSAEAE